MSYTGVGSYKLTSLSASFTTNKTVVLPKYTFNSSGSGKGVSIEVVNTGSITITTQNSGNVAINNALDYFPVEIQVWD